MKNLLKNIAVHFDPNIKMAQVGEVLVGLGNSQESNPGIILQHKTQAKRYNSLSEYINQTDFSHIDPVQDCKTFYIEDYSVDTLVSIWLFLNKINKQTMPENIHIWIDYATRWEQGNTTTTGDAFESYGCLQNAFIITQKELSPEKILCSSLSFLSHLIVLKIDPASIPNHIDNSHYQQAYQALTKEYQKYTYLIKASETDVLNIPTQDPNIIKQVSAIFIQIDFISSLHKVFLRHDKKNSPTKEGFTLIVAYNPKVLGTGSDIVISVDPDKGVQLKKLWQRLEDEENRLWDGNRPDNNARPLKSYPDNNGPNEPWWDDMGKYTLIASPKKVQAEYGRRVPWNLVKKIIKTIY